jgi:hypothetical protein
MQSHKERELKQGKSSLEYPCAYTARRTQPCLRLQQFKFCATPNLGPNGYYPHKGCDRDQSFGTGSTATWASPQAHLRLIQGCVGSWWTIQFGWLDQHSISSPHWPLCDVQSGFCGGFYMVSLGLGWSIWLQQTVGVYVGKCNDIRNVLKLVFSIA